MYVSLITRVISMSWLLLVTGGMSSTACPVTEQAIRFGFYAYFEPVSHSAERDPDARLFDVHRGYEADLLTALEAMKGVNLSFRREGIANWGDIWLLPLGPKFDLVGGGISVLETRARDAQGNRVIDFTVGHIAFRQSLLVRREDRQRLSHYASFNATDRVGVLAGTTGEERLLKLTGLADANGILAAGVRIDTLHGMIVADGSPEYQITAGAGSPALNDRSRLQPISDDRPSVIYMANEEALLEALLAGKIDAVARGDIGNRYAARTHEEALAIGAVDERFEIGAFALAADNSALAGCLNRTIDWLTDGGNIGYSDWLEDQSVFMRRAQLWKPAAK